VGDTPVLPDFCKRPREPNQATSLAEKADHMDAFSASLHRVLSRPVRDRTRQCGCDTYSRDMDLEVTLGTAGDVNSVAELWKTMVEHHRQLVGHEVPVRPADQAWILRR
jgi:hypothetical protein